MANTYSLIATNITDTAVDIVVFSATNPATTATMGVVVNIGKDGNPNVSSRYVSDPGTAAGAVVGTLSFSSLAPETRYYATIINGGTASPISFTTKIDHNTPRAATQEQWEYVVSKIKDLDSRVFTLEN